jgi:hypothetical protein
MDPDPSRRRNPIPRSSSNNGLSPSRDEVTLARNQTHSRPWSGEVSSTSAGSTTPVTRTSPAASVAIRDVDVSPTRAAER